MANEDSSKSSTNLKVPPLKIVLSSHQNNTVVNRSSNEEDQLKSSESKLECNGDQYMKESGRRASAELKEVTDRAYKRGSKNSTDRGESDSGQTLVKYAESSSSSSSNFSLDRSTSTSPSSESESLASNSTIISESTQVRVKTESRDETTPSRPERASRCSFKASTSDRTGASTKDQAGDSGPSSSREQTLNANQRITRSSQRAAQQVRFENPHEQIGDDPVLAENQDKVQETARRVKRRKNELQEAEPDPNQTSTQPAVILANICPADYQLPSQNSFELYRDIRKRPYKKLFKLSHTQPRVPHGFKDYLLNGGPYLLDGNKLGVGLNGRKLETLDRDSRSRQNGIGSYKGKFSNAYQRPSKHMPSNQHHTSYTIPKPCHPPKSLAIDSPLLELFMEQEKARQQMRMQHLKERERSTLAAEQEVLRAYNRASIVDMKQKLHLSACTYFYYQERYHYIDDKSKQKKKLNGIQNGTSKCEDENPIMDTEGESSVTKEGKTVGRVGVESQVLEGTDKSNTRTKVDEKLANLNAAVTREADKPDDKTPIQPNKSNPEQAIKDNMDVDRPKTNGCLHDEVSNNINNSSSMSKGRENSGENKVDQLPKCTDLDSDNSMSDYLINRNEPKSGMSEEDLKRSNKDMFLSQLQEIDDKWDKIRKDMLVRHKNESDSLYAVQTLEWEWKAKEIGACDVRVSLKVGAEFVPRVEILALDY